MGGKTFDLIESISDLLNRIEKGRQTIIETQKLRDDFQKTYRARDKAGQLWHDLQNEMNSLDEPAKSQAKVECDLQESAYQKLSDESDRLWLQSNETIAFIEPLSKDVSRLLERLPLQSDWDQYREAVRCIDVTLYRSWTSPPADSALGTLEMRLKEMLALAIRTKRGQERRFEPFPTPEGASWKDLLITFISEHRVHVDILDARQTRNYAEMGFEDQRGGGGKPDSAWELLRLLAKSAGKIERPSNFNKPGWLKIEKRVQVVRARLEVLFGLPGDPLPFRRGSGYKAQFEIQVGNSIEH